MRTCTTGLSMVLAGLAAAGALAQRPASTVQLPTRSHFATGTTVWVPDRGSAYLGGVQRARSHRTAFGLPLLPTRPHGNAVRGGIRGASSMHATVTVHDFAAMDKYLLSQPTRFSQSLRPASPETAASAVRATTQPPKQTRESIRNPRARPGFGNPPAMSVAAARAMHERRQAASAKEAAACSPRVPMRQ